MKCSFCKNEIVRGTGKMYIQKDGKVLYFCSSKCEKNMLKLKRKPRDTRWTGEAVKIKSESGKQQPKPAEKKEAKPKKPRVKKQAKDSDTPTQHEKPVEHAVDEDV